jgi:hypothetical protein
MKVKKPAPNKEGNADVYEWMVVRKYGKPVYYKEWKDAWSRLTSDVEAERDTWEMLMAVDGIEACNNLLETIGRLTPGRPASVSGITDPVSGMKYVAEIRRRDKI